MNLHANYCPICKFDLDGGDVYETMLEKYPDDPEHALRTASYYGWTEETPVRWSKALGCYDSAEDRTIGWVCPECNGWIK